MKRILIALFSVVALAGLALAANEVVWKVGDSAYVDAEGDATFNTVTASTLATTTDTAAGHWTVTSNLYVGVAGVVLTGDGDGAVTILGAGNGSDEDIKINLDDTANTAVITSSTGLDTISLSGIGLSAVAITGSGTATFNGDTVIGNSTNDVLKWMGHDGSDGTTNHLVANEVFVSNGLLRVWAP